MPPAWPVKRRAYVPLAIGVALAVLLVIKLEPTRDDPHYPIHGYVARAVAMA
jgi:hypothetical protein